MATLYLSEQDVDQALDMPLAVQAMDEAFRALAAGQADNVPRVRAQSAGIVLHSMSAAAGYLGLVGWKQYTTTRSGAVFHVGLYDQQTGKLLALIAANRLGQLRTGAVTGLAARRLADPPPQAMGLFGTGWQAQSQLAAVAAACPLRRALVYSRRPEHRRPFAERMSAQLGIEVVPVDEPRQAVENLPLVVTVTNSRQPVFEGQWLAAGTLVCAAGSNWPHKAEIDATTVGRAATVVCDSVECCRREAGDLLLAEQQGAFDWSGAVELCELVADPAARPRGQGDITLFKSVGMAIEDVALAGKLLEIARSRGLGQTLPL